jgi:large subunit ribosomal protein L22
MHVEATAKARFLRTSGRKARIVADLVRGKTVDEAIALLSFIPKKAAEPIKKVVKSAAANAMSEVGTGRLKAEDLAIKTICVDNGPAYKRFRAASMGRAMPLKHRLCHITVVVAGEAREERQRRKTKTTTREAKVQE